MELTKPNQAVCTDITYISSDEGFLYLALVMDMVAKDIVGWDISESLESDGAVRALKMAGIQWGLPLCPHKPRLRSTVKNRNVVGITIRKDNFNRIPVAFGDFSAIFPAPPHARKTQRHKKRLAPIFLRPSL